MTHREACNDLAVEKYTPYVEVPLGSVWGAMFAREAELIRRIREGNFMVKRSDITDVSCPRADVINVNPSYTEFRLDIFEIKVSRSDALSDLRSEKWRSYLPHCHRLYFATMSGVVQSSEVPEEMGHIVRGDKGWRTTRRAPVRDLHVPEETLLSLLFYRRLYAIENMLRPKEKETE